MLASKFDHGARLVSVPGMGGTAKTRLVTRFAWTVHGEYPGAAWFCDLSRARTAEGIHFAVAQEFDVPVGKTNPVVQLAHAIAGRGRCLVILDRRPDRSVQCPERPRKTLSLSRRPRAGAVLPRTRARTSTSRGPSALGRRRVGEARP